VPRHLLGRPHHPDRLPATYKRTHGIRYFHGCYDLLKDKLWGIVRRRKGGDHTLAALKTIRAVRPDGAPIYVIPENVPWNIFRILLPTGLCGRRRRERGSEGSIRPRRPHNDQSADSQSSSAWSDRQIERGRDPAEVPVGSVLRSASIFALVVISA